MTAPEVVVVGAGGAGLTAALHLHPRPTLLVSAAAPGRDTATSWAQGGIAAAVSSGDSPSRHAGDTLAVGMGISDREAVEQLTGRAPAIVEWLLDLGVQFDRDALGELRLGREAAHSRHRILHAGGDATGAAISEALTAAVCRARHVEVLQGWRLVEILTHRERVVGVVVEGLDGVRRQVGAPAVVLATGGIGQLYRRTTNPPLSDGSALALAARAGASLRDLELVQFHPTALAVRADPLPLLTEAIRGEGGVLINQRGERFMESLHPAAELAPRDVVARAILQRHRAGSKVWLDAREALGSRFPERFPTAAAACLRAGIDPVTDPMPVTPAAHYHLGGVAVDRAGRSSLAGLWACGEAASTEVHGANRLASNSLLEALAAGARVASDILGLELRPAAPLAVASAGESAGSDARRRQLRSLMWEEAGLVRDEGGLKRALAKIEAWRQEGPDAGLADVLLTAQLLVRAALARQESRGVHFRSDYPVSDRAWRGHLEVTPDTVTFQESRCPIQHDPISSSHSR